jgi:hypothetical protein
MTQHPHRSGLNQNARAEFCPKCVEGVDHLEMDRRLGEQRSWCG